MKKRYIILGVVLFVLTIFALNISVYVHSCDGDICGAEPNKLVYIFAKSKLLCSLVGGEYQRHVQGWGSGFWFDCEVKNEWMCHLRGGEIVDLSTFADLNGLLVTSGGPSYCANKQDLDKYQESLFYAEQNFLNNYYNK